MQNGAGQHWNVNIQYDHSIIEMTTFLKMTERYEIQIKAEQQQKTHWIMNWNGTDLSV